MAINSKKIEIFNKIKYLRLAIIELATASAITNAVIIGTIRFYS